MIYIIEFAWFIFIFFPYNETVFVKELYKSV